MPNLEFWGPLNQQPLRVRGMTSAWMLLNHSCGFFNFKFTFRSEIFCSTQRQHIPVMVSCAEMVPGLFVPKTFRSQERKVPMGKIHSRDLSFFCSMDLSFPGTFVLRTCRSQEHSFPPIIVHETFRSQALVRFCRTVVHFQKKSDGDHAMYIRVVLPSKVRRQTALL